VDQRLQERGTGGMPFSRNKHCPRVVEGRVRQPGGLQGQDIFERPAKGPDGVNRTLKGSWRMRCWITWRSKISARCSTAPRMRRAPTWAGISSSAAIPKTAARSAAPCRSHGSAGNASFGGYSDGPWGKTRKQRACRVPLHEVYEGRSLAAAARGVLC
jgi:hypothetical protein